MAPTDSNSSAASCGLDFDHITIEWEFVVLSMAVLVAITVFFDIILELIEHRLEHHGHYLALLRRVYKELIILGLLATILMLVRQFSQFNHDEFVMIEFTHLWLFTAGISLVLQSVCIMLLVRNVKIEWDRLLLDGSKGILEKYDELDGKLKVRPKYLRYLIGKHRIREGMELFLYRDLMVKGYQLPSSFDFTKYLRRSLSVSIVHDIQIDWKSWGILVTMLIAIVVVILLADSEMDQEHAKALTYWVAFGISWLLLLVSVVVNGMLERGRDRLLREAGCSNISHLHNDLQVLTQGVMGKVNRQFFRLGDSSKKKRIISDKTLGDAAKTRNKILSVVYPFKNPSLLSIVFDMVLLVQTFIVGLVLIASLAGFAGKDRHPSFYLFIGLIPHFIMIFFFFPHIIRTMTVLHSMCNIEADSIQIIREVLKLQELNHEVLIRFAKKISEMLMEQIMMYYDDSQSYTTECNGVQKGQRTRASSWFTLPTKRGKDVNISYHVHSISKSIEKSKMYGNLYEKSIENQSPLDTTVEMVLKNMFSQFDNNSKGIVSDSDIVKTLNTAPHSFPIQQKQAMYLLRSFGSHHGFRFLDFSKMLDYSLKMQSTEDTSIASKLDTCFGSYTEMKCNLCGKNIHIRDASEHAVLCSNDLSIEPQAESEEIIPDGPNFSRRLSWTTFSPDIPIVEQTNLRSRFSEGDQTMRFDQEQIQKEAAMRRQTVHPSVFSSPEMEKV